MNKPEQSGSMMAGVVSVVSLALVWGVVWANLPPKGEMLPVSAQTRTASPASVSPVLDLTIPGVPVLPPAAVPSGEETQSEEPSFVERVGESVNPVDARMRQIAEIKCDAELQQVCPDGLAGDDRRRCVDARLKQVSAPCQSIVRQRLVRWKEAHAHRAACLDDVARYCRDVQPGDGRLMQCLQDHAQSVSEPCYRTLPKGKLQYAH